MNSPHLQHSLPATKLRRQACILLFALIAGFLVVPEAQALTCSATFADVGGERVQLKACDHDFSNSNGDDNANFQFDGAVNVAVGDLMLVTIAIDGDTTTLTPPAGWTELEARLSGGDMSSNVWTRVATIADVAKPIYQFTWAGGNEKNQGYMLLFTGTSGLVNFVSAVQGNSSTPNSPAVTPNSPFNLILRMANIDRSSVDDTVQGPGMPGHTDLIQEENTGNAASTRVSISAAFTHQALQVSTGTQNFTATASEGSHVRTISVEPYEFRFSLDSGTTSSVCSMQQVTLRVTDSTGTTVPHFTGTVTLSTSTGNGNWSKTTTVTDAEGALGDTPGDDDGLATYQFVANDAGIMVLNYLNTNIETVDFSVDFTPGITTQLTPGTGVWEESTTSGYTPDDLVINGCEFRISYPAAQMGTCANQDITVSLVDAVTGNAATDYSGTVTITNDEARGSYASVATNFANGAAGVASFDLDITGGVGSSSAVLSYTDTTLDPLVNFDISEDSGSGFTEPTGDATDDPDLEILACEIWVDVVDGSNESDVCTAGAITFSIRAGVSIVQGYDGDLIISTSSGQGVWSGGAGGLIDNGSGSATYNFVALTDLGAANLDLYHPFTGPVNFTVSGTAGNGAILEPSAGNVDALTVVPCLLEITRTSATSDVCRDGQIVTYEIQNRNGVGPVLDYEGTILIQSQKDPNSPAVFKGDWEYDGSATDPPQLAGQISNGAGDDGFATLQFVDDDDGTIDILYVNENIGDWDLKVASAGFTLAGSSTADIEVAPCYFYISYDDDSTPLTPAESDVCSIETVTITLVNSVGTPITDADYVGSINIGTSGAGGGTWSDPGGNAGSLAPGPAESGIAVYDFAILDGGAVTLEFTSLTSGTRNINVSDGSTSDLGAVHATNDPSLNVGLCTFYISYSNGVDYDPGSVSACSFQDVTIEVWDSGGAPASNYTGDIKVHVPLNKGDWSDTAASDNAAGAGFLNGTADDGEMTYRFVTGDGGKVNFRFTASQAGDYNFEIENIVGAVLPADIESGITGEIVVDSLRDPTLTITSCSPSVTDTACASRTGTGTTGDTVNLTITAESTLQDRLIVAVAAREGVGVTPNPPTFDGVTMSLLHREQDTTAPGSSLEMWYLLEAATIPAGTGPHSGVFSGATGQNWGYCFLSLSEVAQVLPVYNATTPEEGTLNYNNSNFDAVSDLISTTITTTENNSLVLSAVSSASAANNWIFDDLSPEPPITRLFGITDANNPEYGQGDEAQFAGGSGIAPIAAAITISDTEDDYNAAVNTQIVAAFEPRVSGPPIAVGYEPVKLFQTYSGNYSYRAFGASLRPGTAACTFVNNPAATSGGTTTATLTLPGPPGESTVQAAWLYWFGSGSDDVGTTGIDNQVTLVRDPNGTPTSTVVDAIDVFIIDNVGSSGTLDFFAGYADVTGFVTDSGEYGITGLNIDFGTPWSSTSACAGGWAMIVVYENDFEQLRVLNLFQGFQPFQNSAFTLVPRNFRMASPSGALSVDGNYPNGQITHVTVEGDYDLATGDESLGIQVAPGSLDYTTLITPFNPEQAEFNSTITRPVYSKQTTVEGDRYLIDATNPLSQANVIENYELDFPVDNPMPGPLASPPAPPPPPNTYYLAGDQVGTSYGVDIDTHYVQGAVSGETLFEFADVAAEEITTRYSSGQDLVLLVSEVISVTNAPLADIEIFKTGPATATVDTTQEYTFNVTNNGDGTGTGGFANGQIIVTDILPAGMTFDTAGADVSGLDWSCTETAVGVDPGAFTCIYEISTDYNYEAGTMAFAPDPDPGSAYFPAVDFRLGEGEFLPPITANVKIGGSSVFAAQSTDVTNVARVLHSGGSCTVSGTPGISPDPDTCDSAQFDNVNDLQGGTLDLNDIDEKTANNNNVSALTTEIVGIATDLAVVKTVAGVLEAGSTAQYSITVTNNGPDTTTTAFTLTDAVPAGLTFDSIDGATHADWNCTTTSPLSCFYDGAGLPVATPISVVLNVTVTGSAGQNVTNIATVATATGNFDSNTGNNTATNIKQIIPPPAATTERFLLSVSEDNITLGSLEFDRGDLVIYNPDTNIATPFFINNDESEIDITDINAVHLLQNGHIVMSPNGASTADDIPGGFGAEDIVVWDPILKTTTLLFEGAGKFDEIENIDAVYMLENGDIVFSTVDAGSWNSDAVEWDKSDLLRWDGSAVTKYLDGGDATVFGAEDAAQVDAVYVRVADANANAVQNTFWLSASTDPLGGTVNAGTTAGTFGNAFGQDDLLELSDPNSEIAASVSSTGNLLFSGNTPLGVFTGAASSANRIDAVHIVEDGYHGHFSIVEDQGGTTCAPGRIRISKHLGLSHLVDTGYSGTITIKSSNAAGSWTINSGGGSLDNEYKVDNGVDPFGPGLGTTTDGEASYTFVPGDMGTVVLNFTTGTAGMPQSFDVDVSNYIVGESNDEDEDFNFLDDITNVIFADNFDTVSYARNDGSTSWAGPWVDSEGAGVQEDAGNILIESNKLSITATAGAGSNPSIARTASFSNFDTTEDVFLNFEYTYSNLSGADEITIEVSDDVGSGDNYTVLSTYTAISGTNLITPQVQNLNINGLIGAPGSTIDLTDINANGITIRISVTAGYLLSSKFFIDNLNITTGTNACGIGQISHYAVYIGDPLVTGNAATEIDGIACVGSLITIQGHDDTDFPSEPGETITLRTLTTPAQKGSWASLVDGSGAFNDTGTAVDGIATYTFPPGETSATFLFNYTNPLVDGDKVNFNIDSGYPILATEDPTLNVRLAGLRFYNETADAVGIPNQIASKPSDTGFNAATIAIQAVRSSDQDPMQCVPLFEDGRTLDFEFALECVDPATCAAEQAGDDLDAYVNDQLISRVADNGGNGASVYGAEFSIPMVTQASGDPGGTIKIEYKDAGTVRLNARWEIPLDNDVAGLTVGDYLLGDFAFNVRPFGLDIDFNEERFSATAAGGGTDINTLNSYADDANDTVFATAGEAFTTTVAAVGWQAGDDDDNNDGIPDAGADLSDNQVTRNFGNESTSTEYDVLLTLNQVVAPPDGVGVLTDNRAANFSNGEADVDTVFDEVGIIDLDARLVENNLATDDTFMGLNSGDDPGSVLRGAVKNVGRFVPKDFILTLGSITNRSLARVQPSCSAPTSSFTYMGEQFGFSATVTARNGLGSPATTKNYVGAFAKLNSADFPANRFAAVNQLENNADLSVRMADGPAGANRVVTWGLSPLTDGGVATLTGDLVFERDTGAPNEQPVDGPYTALTIGLLDTAVSTEYAGVTRPFVLDLDRGNDASDDATAIADAEFRYGRLVLENAFGPETEPLEISFRVEYWDGPTNGFVLNSDDSCTTIEFDSATDLSDSPTNDRTDERSIRFLDGDNGLLESFEGNLDDGEVEIEALAAGASPKQDVFVGLVNGVTTEPLATPSPAIENFETERLMEVTAPGLGNDGAVYIEFNLSDSDLGFSLDFLSYDWRTDPTDLDDVTADDDYRDNPRARLDFGSYRGHDRVINWQEIYIGPSQ